MTRSARWQLQCKRQSRQARAQHSRPRVKMLSLHRRRFNATSSKLLEDWQPEVASLLPLSRIGLDCRPRASITPPPKKSPFPWGGSGRQPTAWSLGPPRVHTRNGISVGDQQTYTQTNHATCATVGRILCYGLRCGSTRVFIQPTQAATSLRSVPACRLKIYMLCMHLKHNSCHMSRWPWPMPHPSAICVELPCGSRQPMTGRLATHPSNTLVKIYRMSQKARPH